jgi:very-short-patch-repair endonuclease
MLAAMGHAGNIDRQIDGQCSPRRVEGLIAELAERQHGLVGRWQLLGIVGRGWIEHKLRVGWLHPIYRGVYAVGHRQATRESEWMAAVLAGGPGAVLSHRAAGVHWGLWAGWSRIDVTAPRKLRAKRGLTFHRRALPADEVTIHDGIPITTVPRALFDMAASIDVRQLERAINEAEVKRLYDELSLVDLLYRYPRRPGARNVRAALDRRNAGATLSKSDLEALFLAFAERENLPRPETNVVIEGCEVDCVWREQGLVIEVDGWETHKTRAAFERDREKSRILQAAGWRCVPVTFLHLRDGSRAVARDVRRILGATV